MSLAFGFALPHWQAISGGFSPASLFAGGTVAGAWYDPSDLTTMFTTSAGTTPVAMPGQGLPAADSAVGLMLDKSKGLQRFWSGYFDGSGDNLEAANSAAFQFGTGDFTIEGWIYQTETSGYRIIAQCAANGGWANGWTFAAEGNNRRLELWVNGSGISSTSNVLSANTWTHVAVTRSGSTITFWVNGVASGTASSSADLVPTRGLSVGNQTSASFLYQFAGYISNLRVVKGTAVYTGNFTPPSPVTGLTAISGTSLLTCQNSTFIDNSGNAFAITVNGNTTTSQNIPLGNHAISIAPGASTSRPELSARVNLLTYSEEFQNAAWTKAQSTISANTTATTDPLGGTTADKLIENTDNNRHFTYQLPNVAAASYTYSIYAKAAERSWLAIDLTTGANFYCWFDLQNGVLGTVNASRTASITAVGNGWYRCTVTASSLSGSVYTAAFISTADNVISYTGDGTSGIYIWGADLRPANIGAAVPAYQRIADANTYDTNGFPLYLQFDGADDGMYTPANLDLSATDKVGVFAGVRKTATTIGVVTELSANSTSNNGSFYVVANNGPNDYGVSLRGTAQVVYQPVTYTAPISNVLTALYDIAGASIADELVPRVNGIVEQENPTGANAGTGNFGTYPLNIGVRSAASSPTLYFNGHLHGLIVVGSAVSAGNISATESWMAGKTGIVIP